MAKQELTSQDLGREFEGTCRGCPAVVTMRVIREKETGELKWHPYNPGTSGQSHFDTCPSASKFRRGNRPVMTDPAHQHVWRSQRQKFEDDGAVKVEQRCATPGCFETRSV
jgi:hypothetical protein